MSFTRRFQQYWPGLAVVGLLVLVTGVWVWLGGERVNGWLDFSREFLQQWGWWAILPYTALFVLLGAIGVPPAILILPAAWVWTPWMALGVSLVGGLGAALLGFWGSRHFVRDWVEKRIPPKIRDYEERLETHALSTVIILRLLFFLFPPITWLLGLSHISLRTFVAGTLIGCLPFMLIVVFTGESLIPWVLDLPPIILLITALVVALAFVCWFFWIARTPVHHENLETRGGESENA